MPVSTDPRGRSFRGACGMSQRRTGGPVSTNVAKGMKTCDLAERARANLEAHFIRLFGVVAHSCCGYWWCTITITKQKYTG